ncbi:hypothetical protein P6N53_01490 [Desulforamulus aquiferis]|uniref:PhnB-like domain-containing protein n=1 Tax=Desulforamulus aquiferis TaxID=1397668 RepID=A0AAW7Z8I1_9FIRM|nr:hypothetical protein [Desulforamulus aquiferis]
MFYINFNGNCREAVAFYAEVFAAEKPQIMTLGDTPACPEFSIPEEAKNLVMHTRLNIMEAMSCFLYFSGYAFCCGKQHKHFHNQ